MVAPIHVLEAEDGAKEPAVKLGLHLNGPGALQGYTLLSPLGATKTYLLDMDGRVVRTWDCGNTPMSSYILENGRLLRFGKLPADDQKFGTMPGEAGRIQEFTFDGELVWDFRMGNESLLPHHDIHRMPNGNVLMIVWEKKSRDDAIAWGRAPESLGDKSLIPDYLVEIKPTGKTSGEIVWEWHLWDHVIQDRDPSKANYGDVAAHPELVDLNFGEEEIVPKNNPDNAAAAVNQLAGLGYVGAPAANRPMFPQRDWTHFNGIDYNAELDQIVISVHGFSEFWIIDHSTTTEEAKGHTGGRSGKGGDLLYRWGNPRAYRAGTKDDQTLFAQHNAQWIDKGLSGEGHILVFNNRHHVGEEKYSSVDEIELPVDENGNYDRPAGAPFGPRAAVWSYTAPKRTDFYSNFISGAQRLANGNTLICSGAHGILFEVTADKDLVWKYINPTTESPFDSAGPGPGGNGPGANGPPPPPPRIGELLPRFLQDQLHLDDEQRKRVAEIEQEALAKLDDVLNAEQSRQFAEMRNTPPGGPAPPGPPAVAGPNFGPPAGGGAAAGPNFGPPRPGPAGGAGGPPSPPPDLLAGPPGGTPVFRAYRYGADYVGFKGHDMTPGKTLVEIIDEQELAKAKEKDSAGSL
jgi:hypothetical protein